MAMVKVGEILVSTTNITSVTIDNIPQDGKDLLLVFSTRNATSTTTDTFIRLNGSATGYLGVSLTAQGANMSTQVLNSANHGLNGISSATANTFSSNSAYIFGYTSSQNKNMNVDAVNETNGTAALRRLTTARFTSSTPITSISVGMASTSHFMSIGSTISLYIIK